MALVRGGNLVLWGGNQAKDPAVLKSIDEYADVIGFNMITLNPYYNHFSNNDPLGYRVGRSNFYSGSGSTPDVLPSNQNPQWYSDDQLIKLIDYIHSKGMNVFLKPMIDPAASDHAINGQRSGLDPGSAQIFGAKTVSGSPNITLSDGLAWPGSVSVGNNINGTNIPTGSIITGFNAGRTQITISNNASGTGQNNCTVLLGSFYTGSTIAMSSLPATVSVNSAVPFSPVGGTAMLISTTGVARFTYTGTDTTANTLTGCSFLSGTGNMSNATAIYATAAAVWQEYQNFLTHYATILQAHYVAGDIFSVGCELTNMIGGNGYIAGTSMSWATVWSTIVIPAVRAVTSAKLTFSGYTLYGPTLWSALDYLGIDYYPGSGAPWPKTNGATTLGSNVLVLSAAPGTVPLDVNTTSLRGSGIPRNTVITAIDGLNITMSKVATSTNASTSIAFGTTNVAKLQAKIAASIAGFQSFVDQNGGKKLMITEHTTSNVQATCYGLSSADFDGPNEPEVAAWYQALIQECESGNYSWYAGIQTWCCYHINDPVHWTTWRKQAETAAMRSLWKLGKPAQTTLMATDGGYPKQKGILPTNIIQVNAGTTAVSPITGQSVTSAYFPNPGDVLYVTTGSSTINIYLPPIAYKTGSVTIRKVDAGSGSIVVTSLWRTYSNVGNFDNYPNGHCQIDGANSKTITAVGSTTLQSDGSDYYTVTPATIQRFMQAPTTKAQYLAPSSAAKTAKFIP